MRGKDEQQLDVFSYISPEQRVPHDHPLRPLRVMTDEALRELQPRFNKLYAKTGRPSIAPEKLLRALLLQALYSVRSERMLMEQLNYNLLFRWFVGLNMDDSVWDVTVFTKNRERLLDGDIAEAFFQAVLQQARERNLLSDEHFTVDGTLLEAWASVKSYQRKDAKNGVPPDDPGNATVDFHGEKRSNETHQSKTDPDAKMARKGKGKEAKLSYNGNLLVENRHGLIVSRSAYSRPEQHERCERLGLGIHQVAQDGAARPSRRDQPGRGEVGHNPGGADRAGQGKPAFAACRDGVVRGCVGHGSTEGFVEPPHRVVGRASASGKRVCAYLACAGNPQS